MSANVIPVDMRGDSGHRLVRQLHNLIVNTANAELRVNQQAAFRAD